MIIGLVLLVIGAIALLVNLGVLTGSIWGYAWPIILIVVGLGFIFGRRHHRHGFMHCCWPRDDEEKK